MTKTNSIVSLRDYTDRMIGECEEKIEERFKAIDKATEVFNRLYEYQDQQLGEKIDALEKLVYMGLGIVLTIEFVLRFFVK